MERYTMIDTDFWSGLEGMMMTPQEKYFYIYLLTNDHTNHIGIYQISKKQIAFDLDYSIEVVQSLMEQFTLRHKMIRYNPEVRELAIQNWGKHNLYNESKPVMDCIFSELRDVEDPSLIQYVLESIQNQKIRSLYESFCEQGEM
ncbi:hypothetical protein ACWM35_12640 [Neobacillus sp. K501]